MADRISATPRNPILGYIADLVAATYSPERTQQTQGVAQFMGAPAVAATLDRMSYGEPLTTGAGMTTRPRPETLEAGLAMTDFLPQTAMAKAAAGLGGLAGIFAGKGAKTADLARQALAEKLLKEGAEPAQVWRETGWALGPDGKWRFEIPDDAAVLKRPWLSSASGGDYQPTYLDAGSHAKIGDFVQHDLLNDAYDTNYIPLSIRNMQGAKGNLEDGRVSLSSGGMYDDATKSTALHELQHAIQQREGFARGGSPENSWVAAADYEAQANDKLAQMRDYFWSPEGQAMTKPQKEAYKKRMQDIDDAKRLYANDPYLAYQSLAGEAEARLTQSRIPMTMEERLAQYPYDPAYFQKATGAALDSLIYRQGDGGVASTSTRPEYGIQHRPPMRDSGAPLWDLTGGGNVYPDDVYSKNAVQYYGTGDQKLDRETFRIINSHKDNPDATVTIYRTVGKEVPDSAGINPGDWVTVNPDYAKQHGESVFEGEYRVIKKRVKAKDIFTSGDSIHEFGYDPAD